MTERLLFSIIILIVYFNIITIYWFVLALLHIIAAMSMPRIVTVVIIIFYYLKGTDRRTMLSNIIWITIIAIIMASIRIIAICTLKVSSTSELIFIDALIFLLRIIKLSVLALQIFNRTESTCCITFIFMMTDILDS